MHQPIRHEEFQRPYQVRQCPEDFVLVFIRIGWAEIEMHYGAHKLTVKRWIGECGGKALVEARAAFVRRKRHLEVSARRSRRSRNILGRRGRPQTWDDGSAWIPETKLDRIAREVRDEYFTAVAQPCQQAAE